MGAFPEVIAQMIAKARLPQGGGSPHVPVITLPPAAPNPTMAPFASQLASGISKFLEEESDPAILRERALAARKLWEGLPEETRAQMRANPDVQRQFRKYYRVAPELFTVERSPAGGPQLQGAILDFASEVPTAEERIKRYEAGRPITETQAWRAAEAEIQRRKALGEAAEYELGLKKKIEDLSIEQLRAELAKTQEAIKSMVQERKSREELLPLEKREKAARALSYEAQAGAVPAEIEEKKARTQLLKTQAEHYESELETKLAVERMKERSKEHTKLLDTREAQDKELRNAYLKLGELSDPKGYAKADAASTQSMVDAMGFTQVPIGNRGVAEVPTAMTSPVAKFWINKSLDELYAAFLDLYNKDPYSEELRNLYDAAFRLYESTYKKTYQMARSAPEIKDYLGDMIPQETQLRLLYMKYIVDRALLAPAEREAMEQALGGRVPPEPKSSWLWNWMKGLWR
jgi:hypothetical protein